MDVYIYQNNPGRYTIGNTIGLARAPSLKRLTAISSEQLAEITTLQRENPSAAHSLLSKFYNHPISSAS